MTERNEKLYGPPLPTAAEAAGAGRMGHNLRCNKCGGYGATWISGARPGWGALALCGPDMKAYYVMIRRHADELSEYTNVKFEQGTAR